MDGPILIGGLDRSGKTQLRLALELLPEIAWVRKVEPWTRFAGRLGDVRKPSVADRAIARLVDSPWLAGLEPDAARLHADLPVVLEDAGSASIAESRLLALMLAHYAEKTGCSRWGLQEAGVERYMASVLDALPGARCILLVRDPRDRLAAFPAGRRRFGAAGPAAAAWLASVRHAKAAARRHPERVLIVRLEDLVARPAQVLRTICEHVDAEYSDALLDPPGGRPFDALAGRVGRFRDVLTAGQVELIQSLAPRAMIALGYEPAEPEFSSLGRARYWLYDAPVGLLRLTTSRVRAAAGRLS
ncbi:MAG TPA: sulfotransferase [Candidatus Limnocylindrales bacterium]|jgi:hypothetical protein